MRQSPLFQMIPCRARCGALLMMVVALAAGAAARAATPGQRVGMVEAPCLELPPRPAELDERREIEMRPEEPDPAALARPVEPETRVYFSALDEAHKQDWPNLCRFQAENAAIPHGAHIQAVFLGDSITENWIAADPALFSDRILNRGISGQTTPQMLLRFYADVIALHPRVVHILAGANDLAGNTGPSSAQQYKDNIMAMCDLASANGVRVVLASLLPAERFPWRPEVRPVAQIDELNRWLRRYAAQRKFVYVDYYAVLAGPGGAMRAGLSHDGVHPHRAGYVLMRPLTQRGLAAALQAH